MTSKTTTETVTDRQIRALLSGAGEAGDLVQAHICRVALGAEDPVDDADAWEERYGGGGFDRREQAAMQAVSSVDEARAICASAIASAEAAAE